MRRQPREQRRLDASVDRGCDTGTGVVEQSVEHDLRRCVVSGSAVPDARKAAGLDAIDEPPRPATLGPCHTSRGTRRPRPRTVACSRSSSRRTPGRSPARGEGRARAPGSAGARCLRSAALSQCRPSPRARRGRPWFRYPRRDRGETWPGETGNRAAGRSRGRAPRRRRKPIPESFERPGALQSGQDRAPWAQRPHSLEGAQMGSPPARALPDRAHHATGTSVMVRSSGRGGTGTTGARPLRAGARSARRQGVRQRVRHMPGGQAGHPLGACAPTSPRSPRFGESCSATSEGIWGSAHGSSKSRRVNASSRPGGGVVFPVRATRS